MDAAHSRHSAVSGRASSLYKAIPSDINNRMGDADWIGLAWVLAGIAAGALALMCFAVEWALRPGRQSGAHQQQQVKSKI